MDTKKKLRLAAFAKKMERILAKYDDEQRPLAKARMLRKSGGRPVGAQEIDAYMSRLTRAFLRTSATAAGLPLDEAASAEEMLKAIFNFVAPEIGPRQVPEDQLQVMRDTAKTRGWVS